MSTATSRDLDEARVGVRLKISSLWIAMLFLFAYGDIFGFFKPGQIADVISGEVSGIKITQAFLMGASIYIAVASVMVFLSLVLRAAVSRWTNIVLPVLFIVFGLGELSKGFGVLRRFGGDDGISRMDSRDRVGDGRVVAVAATADRRDAMAEFPEHACVPLPDRTEADDNGIDGAHGKTSLNSACACSKSSIRPISSQYSRIG